LGSAFSRLAEQDPQMAQEYLDRADNGDKQYSEGERRNAVLEWGLENFAPQSPVTAAGTRASMAQGRTGGEDEEKDYSNQLDVVENYQPSQMQGGKIGKALKFPYNAKAIPIPAAIFADKLSPKGYPIDQNIDAEFRGFMNDEFEVDITYQDKVPSWKSVTGNKTYADDQVTPTFEGWGTVTENGKTIQVREASLLNKKITIFGKVSEVVLDLLEKSGYKDIRKKYQEYLQQMGTVNKPKLY
jgi:hypothetical protein